MSMAVPTYAENWRCPLLLCITQVSSSDVRHVSDPKAHTGCSLCFWVQPPCRQCCLLHSPSEQLSCRLAAVAACTLLSEQCAGQPPAVQFAPSCTFYSTL